MPRNPLSFGNDAVGDLICIRFAFAALFAFRPAAELRVAPRRHSLRSGRGTTAKAGVFAQYFVSIGFPFVTAIRAFHRPELTTANAYDA